MEAEVRGLSAEQEMLAEHLGRKNQRGVRVLYSIKALENLWYFSSAGEEGTQGGSQCGGWMGNGAIQGGLHTWVRNLGHTTREG